MKKLSITLLCLVSAALIYAQTWSLASTVPGQGREAAESFSLNGKIYIGGGINSNGELNDFYQFDPSTNTWTRKANIPDNICASTCFALDGMGYVVCGEDYLGLTTSVYQYNPATDQWTTKESFPGTACMDPVAFTIGDTGYIYGGFIGGDEINTLWAYNPHTDTWTQKASMPSHGRSSAQGFVLNNIAYIGLGEYNSSQNYPSDILAYNATTNTWSTIAQFPGHLRAGATGFTIGNYGYVGLGGYVSGGTFYGTNDIYQYDPNSNSWTAAGNFPGPARGNSVCQNVGNIIYSGTGEIGSDANCITDWWRFVYHVTISMAPGQTVCNGSNIILNPVVQGGIAPFTYSWTSTGDSLSCNNCQNPSVTITKNDTFIITISDANNTVTADTVIYGVNGNQSAIQASLTNTNITCQSPADTTQVTVTNGVSPFVFQWGDGTSTIDLSPANHLFSQAGVYVFTITDSSGCATSLFDTIVNTTVAISLAAIVPPICLYDSSGKIFVNVTGGTPPYTYSWTTGGTTDSVTHIPAGDYSVTVTDATSCVAQFSYQLNTDYDVWGYYLYLYPIGPNCTNNGSISASVSGGYAPYTFVWSDSATTQNIQNLNAGTYSVTVTDSTGCPRQASTILNFDCSSVISGYVFVDSNNNCFLDAGETPIAETYVSAYVNGNYYYGFTDWTGYYTVVVPDTGTYYLQTSVWDGFCTDITLCGNPSQMVTISNLGDSSVQNNFVVSFAYTYDLTIHPGWTSADPGFQKEYWVMPYDQSFVPFTGQAMVTFTFDSNLVYQFSLPPVPAYNPIAHTLTWVLDSVPYPIWDWNNFRFQNFFLVPDDLNVGYLLQSDFYITPTAGDCDTSNNHLHFSETVVGSHDPNSKTVVPANNISPDDSLLTYTIHFQNTGTDSTWFITVQDTLSPNLDPSSVKNIASSAPYTNFTIQGKGTLTWTFDPFRLVDSITNPSGSQGFITFSVKKKAGLSLGATIANTAYVYFDYNNAVITNTVSDTVAIPLAIPVIQADNGISVSAFPNPFNSYTNFVVAGISGKYDFELYDVTGRLSQSITSVEGSQFKVIKGDLAAGMYFFHISAAGKQVAYGKLVME